MSKNVNLLNQRKIHIIGSVGKNNLGTTAF